MSTRKAISPFIATLLLIGITATCAGITLSALSISDQNLSCHLVNAKLYKISNVLQAHFIITLVNTGDVDVVGVEVMFADDLGSWHGFDELITLHSGDEFSKNQSFSADIQKGNSYLIDANIRGVDNSTSSCILSVLAR